MRKQQKIDLISELIEEVNYLFPLDLDNAVNVIREAKMIIKNIGGEFASEYIRSLNSISFTPVVYPASEVLKRETWDSGKQDLLGVLNTIKREIELFATDVTEKQDELNPEETPVMEKTKKVFIVHGHDDAMKLDVARTIEKLKLEAIILHEQDDEGKTVIEKFETNAIDCGFAVVLLSPDDIAFQRNKEENKNYRARQNVILELGYFIGSIGRQNVLPLVKDDPAGKLEIPSDYAGVVYTPYDGNTGGWKSALFKSLKSSGFSVDANDLF